MVYKRLKTQDSRLKIGWLIGKHSGYHKWVLPKGLIEKGEKGYETAVREVQEEMGKELLTRIEDYGVPFFRRADDEEATIVEQDIVTPSDVDRSIEVTPRRRGRPPQLNKDANGESDSGAVTV